VGLGRGRARARGAALRTLLQERGQHLVRLGTRKATLEDVFVSLTGRLCAMTESQRPRPVVQLTLMRLREMMREPGALFGLWISGAPLGGAGIAFRVKGPEPVVWARCLG